MDCGLQNSTDDFNSAYRTHQTDRSTKQLGHALSPCVGSGPGLGVNCSAHMQDAQRGGRTPAYDPVMSHRSYMSSACPPNEYNTPQMMDAGNAPRAPKTETDLFSYQTRDFFTDAQLTEHDMSSYHMSIPNQQLDGYRGYNQGLRGDINIPSRMVALGQANAHYHALKNVGPSAGSYASYGTA